MNPTVDVIIPVYKPNRTLLTNLALLLTQTYPIEKVILLNTVSHISIKPYVMDPRIEVISVLPEDFDHGGTRHLGATHSSADIIVFMTQDASPYDEQLIEALIKPLEDDKVSISYAQQLADYNADPIELYTREFNYPKTSHIKSKEDLPTMGIKTFFCSNVCAAYRRVDYLKLGGFITKTIFNEDMIFAAETILSGKCIAYSADAKVIHSHTYTMLQSLRRNFDLAVSQADHPDIFSKVKSTDEGIKYIKKVITYLIHSKHPFLIPYFIVQSGMRYIGYTLGLHYKKLPRWVILICSMNNRYWG